MQDKYAAQDDWETHRPTITRLYLDEHKTLREVKKHMETHHFFFATEKMYKTRIKKWSLDKNNKMAEVVHMVRLKAQRDKIGKRSVFSVRNRPVDWKDIERYLHRTPGCQAKISHTDDHLELGSAALGIVCRTPSPDPVQMLSVPPKLNNVREIHLHEEVLTHLRTYMDGAFSSGLWVLSETDKCYFARAGGIASLRLSNWFEKVECATGWEGGTSETVRLINTQMDELASLLKDQEPSLLYCLIQTHFNLSLRRPALGKLVSPFILNMCNIVLGPHHPMTRVLDRLGRLPMPDLSLTVERTAKFRLDYFQSLQTCDVKNWSTVFALYQYANALSPGPPSNAQEVERVTRLTMDELDPSTSLRFQIDCQVLFKLSSINILHENWAMAEEVLTCMGAFIARADPSNTPYYTTVVSLFLRNMGLLRFNTGRKREARQFLRENYNFCMAAFGPEGFRTVYAVAGLLYYDVAETEDEARVWRRYMEVVDLEAIAKRRSLGPMASLPPMRAEEVMELMKFGGGRGGGS
ncbi:Clr5 domain-containing protein [Bombardia bombarda]|uniref:Clr5 domain-containing protein n=1 Tax=Bombardia bombarda TaxID=252184 RepID=A0AA39WV32_9PEZI|nr:Clr5 domain-containing protein [Bombardia bombarda]